MAKSKEKKSKPVEIAKETEEVKETVHCVNCAFFDESVLWFGARCINPQSTFSQKRVKEQGTCPVAVLRQTPKPIAPAPDLAEGLYKIDLAEVQHGADIFSEEENETDEDGLIQ